MFHVPLHFAYLLIWRNINANVLAPHMRSGTVYTLALRWVSTSRTAHRSSLHGAIDGNGNLHCIALHWATLRKNEHDPAAVGSSKENMFLCAFGWNRNWLITECDCDSLIFRRKKFFKKGQSSPKTSSLGNRVAKW